MQQGELSSVIYTNLPVGSYTFHLAVLDSKDQSVQVESTYPVSYTHLDSAIWRFSLRILLVPVIAGVAYEFLRLAGRSENAFVNLLSKPGLWFQKFTTKEPDEDMIEVAIASVEAVFDWKPYVEKVRGEGAAEAD